MQPLLLQGVPFADSLKPFPFLFPLETQSMIEVGGRVGKLEESFIHVSSYYERSLKTRTKTLTSLVEPILMIFTGIVVGIIALSVFLPIYQTAYTNIL
jgi:type IV pilus assembly protein PilC